MVRNSNRAWLDHDEIHVEREADELCLSIILSGLTGERNVYKRRGQPEEKGLNMTKPKHLTLLVDVSGSMYR